MILLHLYFVENTLACHLGQAKTCGKTARLGEARRSPAG